MSEVYESLMEGLNEALAFVRGEKTGAIVHHVAVPAVDVAAIRAGTGLSQSAFARSIGVEGVRLSSSQREDLWASYSTAAPRRRTPFERSYSDRKLRSRSSPSGSASTRRQ